MVKTSNRHAAEGMLVTFPGKLYNTNVLPCSFSATVATDEAC